MDNATRRAAKLAADKLLPPPIGNGTPDCRQGAPLRGAQGTMLAASQTALIRQVTAAQSSAR